LPICALAQQVKQVQQPSVKRPLTHLDYDSWLSIQSPQLSPDGKFIAYALIPLDGDGEMIVRNLVTGVEWRYSRGWRPPLPMPDSGDPAAAQFFVDQRIRLTRSTFTADNRFVIFTIEPNKADVLKARKERKKPEEAPKNALGVMDLSSGKLTRIERVKSFQIPEDGSGYIAYMPDLKPEEKGEGNAVTRTQDFAPDLITTEASTTPLQSNPREKNKEYGSVLVLRNLFDNVERAFTDVVDYSFSRDAKSLIYIVSSKKEDADGVYVITPGSDSAPLSLLTGNGRYSRLTWDENQKQLVFISDKDDVAADQPNFKLYYWNRVSAKATEIISPNTPNFRRNSILSERAAINFSRDGSRLFFSVRQRPEPVKNPDADLSPDEKVVFDLWHWKDEFVQPMQKARAEQDRNRSYRAVYHLLENKYVQLADDRLQNINPSGNGLWAIGTDDRSYRLPVGWEFPGAATDVFLVNTLDGTRKEILKKQRPGVSLSPDSKYVLFYDGKDWNTISIPQGKVTNLTKGLGVNFWQEENDVPDLPPSYGSAGWVKDDRYVLLYDQYDIWQIAPDGSSAKNLTDGVGRSEGIEFRYVRLDPQEKWIDPGKQLLLRVTNHWTLDSGFYQDRVDGGRPEKLIMAAKNFSPPSKAKDADVLTLTATRFDEAPDLIITNSTFKDLKKVSNLDAQKDKFLWGTSELIRYRNADGAPLSGVLIKPENFDPKRKYPMLVHIYERFSHTLHDYQMPYPGHFISRTLYASNGYLVFMPDIIYTIGSPGQSALKSVMPGIQAVVDQGFVKEDAIGIQGHSWGGYQIAYLVTQTNRFRAAAVGAAVCDMVSGYNAIRSGNGLPRQYQYEHAQSRIGGNLWEYPSRYIENSPVIYANRIQTPILMLHNDNDNAVPWAQGIELYLALRRLNKEVYMFNYNGEYHGLYKWQNQKDYARRLQEFFDHHLKGAPMPAWMEKGISFLQRENEK